jgi:hypothetical protein
MSTQLLGPARDPQNATARDVIVDAVAGTDLSTAVAAKVALTIDSVHGDELAVVIMTPQVAERLIESLQAAVRTVTEVAWQADEFLRHVVEPALELLSLNDAASRALLMGTAAVETELMHARRWQLGGGPARGYFQMEPETAVNLLDWLKRERPQYWRALLEQNAAFTGDVDEALARDAIWAAMMTRLRYRWIPAPLPASDDVQGMAEYWKKYYNTPLGKGTVAKFVAKFALVADALAAREASDDWRSDSCPGGIPGWTSAAEETS